MKISTSSISKVALLICLGLIGCKGASFEETNNAKDGAKLGETDAKAIKPIEKGGSSDQTKETTDSSKTVGESVTAATKQNTPVDIVLKCAGCENGAAVQKQPENGAIADKGKDSVTYTPKKDFVGIDKFTYIAKGSTSPVTNHVTVIVSNSTMSVITKQDTPVNIDTSITQYNKITGASNAGTTKTVISVNPTNGTIAKDETTGSSKYTPKTGYIGEDILVFLPDAQDKAIPVIVTILVESKDPTQTGPSTTPIVIDIGKHVTDEYKNTEFVIEVPPKNGTTKPGDTTNVILYFPKPGYIGQDIIIVKPKNDDDNLQIVITINAGVVVCTCKASPCTGGTGGGTTPVDPGQNPGQNPGQTPTQNGG